VYVGCIHNNVKRRRSICRMPAKKFVVIVIVFYIVIVVCSGPCSLGFYESAACTPANDRICTGKKQLTLIRCACAIVHSIEIDHRVWISALTFSYQSNYLILSPICHRALHCVGFLNNN